jgi:hypothetical protein
VCLPASFQKFNSPSRNWKTVVSISCWGANEYQGDVMSAMKEVILNRRKLSQLGIPDGEAMKLAIRLVAQAGQRGMKKKVVAKAVTSIVVDPGNVPEDDHFAPLAQMLIVKEEKPEGIRSKATAAPWQKWGSTSTTRPSDNWRTLAVYRWRYRVP